ncbi:hypothetical protein OCK02_17755 [Rhizobium sp. TRM96647]|uniref:hypothetical protein n=1 Tax=unclassified Rhizobium TaxID=2613769 RepID=UPI0021E6E65A|nr:MULTISPECIES: hypothetical protein [unclassified Rhizobium]MCV3738052.1 hypothetical protein [Rhizobium sp. TRM96647]MCV3759739.1 hypothetical protein [Rhizobium sp. TRM96650]
MTRELEKTLRQAARQGIVGDGQVAGLAAFLAAHGRYIPAAPAPAAAEGIADPPRDIADTEAPRFVRGFHDVLITIGIVVALVGLSGLASVLALLPAVILLSEVLVRRQRLALPAVVLTIAFVQGASYLIGATIGAVAEGWNTVTYACAFLAGFPVLLGLYYWRYRVPLSLALTLISAFALAVLLVLVLLGRIAGTDQFVAEHSLASALVFLLAALGLFAIAMRYDLSDPQRQTRRSDIAFWLHLGAAPFLLYALLAFVFLDRFSGQWPGGQASLAQAAVVIAIVSGFMLVGLVIDRRAFVTSGLVSLGAAIWTLLRQNAFEASSYVYVAILAVGVVVLGVGIFWPALRRLVMGFMPEGIASRLHAVH